MLSTLRFFMILSLVVWVGAIIFFAFVLAPTVFSVLPTRELAGSVVTRSLNALHWMGIICGIVFAAASMAYCYQTSGQARPFAARHLLIYAMLVLTFISQFAISPKMHRLRTDMAVIDNVPVTDARRVEFNRLHQWSTRLEGGVLLCGIVVIVLASRHL
jgi:uncharacterized membrane protein